MYKLSITFHKLKFRLNGKKIISNAPFSNQVEQCCFQTIYYNCLKTSSSAFIEWCNRQGGRVPPEAFHWETFADIYWERERKEKGNMEKKKEKRREI